MNAQKMTQKTLEAIQLAHTTAVERGNQQIEQLHLLYALLAQQDSWGKSPPVPAPAGRKGKFIFPRKQTKPWPRPKKQPTP